MNYKESKEILEKIKGAKKILVNCHRSPDADSLGSALALAEVLESMGKNVEVICPDAISDAFEYLLDYERVRKVYFENFEFSEYEIFFVLDTSGWSQLGVDLSGKENVFMVVIDHHQSNSRFGQINLVDEQSTSTAEIVFALMEDWGVNVRNGLATKLLAGVVGDSGGFTYPSTKKETLGRATRLMDLGGDLRLITDGMFRNIDFSALKFLGKSLDNMQLVVNYGYVWSYVGWNDWKKIDYPDGKSFSAHYFQNVKDTDLGFLVVQEGKNDFNVSFRGRASWVDSSELAGKFGGGGHKVAAGARFQDESLDGALERIHRVVREYVEKRKKRNK